MNEYLTLLSLLVSFLTPIILLKFYKPSKILDEAEQRITEYLYRTVKTEDGKEITHIDSLFLRAGNSIGTSLKMSMLGSKSGDVRLTKALTQDLMVDMDQSGMLGLLKSFAPNIFARISKNPQILQHPMVQQLIAGLAKGGGGSTGVRNNGHRRSPYG